MTKRLLFKVFLWFWLTIVTTVLLLIGISLLQPEVVESRKISKSMQHNLHHVARVLTKASKTPNFSLSSIAKLRVRKADNIYLSHRDAAKSVVGDAKLSALNLDLLSLTDDTSSSAIYTLGYRAFGPLELQLQGETYRLYLVFPTREASVLVKLRVLPIWVKIAVIFSVSLLLCFWFTRDLLTPIKQLQTAASHLAKGDLASRAAIDEKRQDELGQLGHDFNIMADRLESLVNNHKRLLADISHELRSPLTRLQMAAGLAAKHSSEASEEYIVRIEREAQLVEHMLGDILHLAKLESDQVPLEKHKISLVDLLDSVLDDAQFEAQQLAKQVVISPLPEVSLYGDPMLLNRAFENIIRNAIKYAKQQVEIEFSCHEQRLTCTIRDDGDGVPRDMLDKLCIPFFRASSARTPAQQKGGFGLGLAIAQHALKVHDAHIQFTNKVGLEVTIMLPTV